MEIRVIILGLSKYGMFLSESLRHDSVEIVAVDTNEERMNRIKDVVSRPVIGNPTKRDLLEELHVEEADHVVVALESLQNSILCVLHLQELNVRNLLVQVLDDDHLKILHRLNVTELVFPEHDMAKVTAQKLLHPNVIDRKALNQHESLVELRAPERFVGQTLAEAGIFKHHHVHLLLVKPADLGDVIIPADDYQFNADDHLLVVGENADVLAFGTLT